MAADIPGLQTGWLKMLESRGIPQDREATCHIAPVLVLLSGFYVVAQIPAEMALW